MSLLDTLARGRAAAESRMTDTCKITTPGVGVGPWNSGTGSYDPAEPVTVYEGKCRIPNRGSAASRSTSGVESWNVGEYPIDLPFTGDTANIEPGMTVKYLTAPDNPALVGREFGISEPLFGSQQTALRFKMKTAVGT